MLAPQINRHSTCFYDPVKDKEYSISALGGISKYLKNILSREGLYNKTPRLISQGSARPRPKFIAAAYFGSDCCYPMGRRKY